MTILEAQRDVRTVFLGGFAGQLVSGVVWLASAAAGTWCSARSAMLLLVFGGMVIFPLTRLFLRVIGRPDSLPKGQPMNALAMQAAFALVLNLPLVLAAALYGPNWFFPAFMIAVGAHYLPFIFLYGMWQFGLLAGLLVASGLLIGLYLPSAFSLGAWCTALLLIIFAFVGRATSRPAALS